MGDFFFFFFLSVQVKHLSTPHPLQGERHLSPVGRSWRLAAIFTRFALWRSCSEKERERERPRNGAGVAREMNYAGPVGACHRPDGRVIPAPHPIAPKRGRDDYLIKVKKNARRSTVGHGERGPKGPAGPPMVTSSGTFIIDVCERKTKNGRKESS